MGRETPTFEFVIMLTPTETVVSSILCPLWQIRRLTCRQSMEWVFFVLAFVFLVTRFSVRLSLRQYHAWVSDVLLAIALVCTMGNILCDTLIYKVDGLLEYKNVTQYLGKVSRASASGLLEFRLSPEWRKLFLGSGRGLINAGRFGSPPSSALMPGSTFQSSACS